MNEIERLEMERNQKRNLDHSRRIQMKLVECLDEAQQLHDFRSPWLGDRLRDIRHMMDEACHRTALVAMMMRNGVQVVALAAALSLAQPAEAQYQSVYPGAYPAIQLPSVSPDVDGPTVLLMPDGGTWTINPPASPEGGGMPYYTPPENERYDHYYHDRGFSVGTGSPNPYRRPAPPTGLRHVK